MSPVETSNLVDFFFFFFVGSRRNFGLQVDGEFSQVDSTETPN